MADLINGEVTVAVVLSLSLGELGSAISSKPFSAAAAVAQHSADSEDAPRQPSGAPTWKPTLWLLLKKH